MVQYLRLMNWSGKLKILAFFAHPDDETMLSGGVLALLAQRDVEVHYLSATRGEGGETGEPPLCERKDLGEIRSQELSCAVQALGGSSLHFMGYVDPTVGEDNELFPYTGDEDALVSQLKDIVRDLQPTAIFTHGSNGEYGHPAHQLTHRAARRTIEELGKEAPLLYTVQACYPDHPQLRLTNKNDPADWVFDVSAGIKQKIQAALCHQTQHALFIRHTSEEVGHPVSVPEVIVAVESLHRFQPVNGLSDLIADLLSDAIIYQDLKCQEGTGTERVS